MKFFNIRTIAAAVCAVVVMASTASAATVFPSSVSENTTGKADSLFVGVPDGNSGNIGTAWIGIGGQSVTYDFGDYEVFNGAGSDINVYEVNYGAREFNLITVSASYDGVTFVNISSSIAAVVNVAGDEAHGNSHYAASFDLGSLDAARFIRIDGNGSGSAGGTSAFDLDAIVAINARMSAVPLPAGMPLLLAGLGAFAALRRRARS